MKMQHLLAAVALLGAGFHAAMAGEITLFADSDFRGGRVTLQGNLRDLNEVGFNDRTSSVIVRSGVWQLCEHRDFGGYCAEFGPGEYRVLPNFNDAISSAREVGPHRDGWHDGWREGWANDEREMRRDERRDEWREEMRDERRGWRGGEPVQLFAGPGFHGERVGLGGDVRTLEQVGFNDRASSIVIREGRWEFCEHADFRGECVVLGPGEYASLDQLNNRISSMRRVR
jgi:hypothetical protein